MQYAVLGKTGLRVSRLGFGAMRLPMKGAEVDRDKAVPMIRRAFELGVIYIDSAVGYCNGDSQRAVGEALEGWRDRVVVSTKNHYYNKADDRPWWKNLEDSLERLRVACIDVYHFHGLRWERFEQDVAGRDGQLRWMQKARDQGLVRHIAFSFHDTAEALRKLAETGEFDVVTLQYNLLDRSNEPALPACRKAGLGVVVMGPVGGGRLGSPSEALRQIIPGAASVPEVALRFVLASPNVTVALSGMNEMKQVEENARVASREAPLSTAEKRRVTATLKRYKKLADLYCTGCNYCMPCPHGVNIPRNFTCLNYARVYGLTDLARQQYHRMGERASTCLACGTCMPKCPQNIDIIAQLRETVRTLDDAYGKLLVTVRPTQLASLSRTNGRVDATIRCRLECHNLSDEEVTPELSFAPARNVSVKLAGRIAELGPFEQGRAALTVTARSIQKGEPLRLGASLAGPHEMVYSPEPLCVAIAAKAARNSPNAALKRAPQVRAQVVRGEPKPPAKALAGTALAARFAYSDQALVLELDLRGAFRHPPTKRRSLRDSDAVWLRLDTSKARGLRGKTDRPKQLDILIGVAAKASQPAPVRVLRPRRKREQAAAIRAELAGGAARRRLRIRVPWSLLGVASPKAGASLGANFALACPRRGRPAWQLAWAEHSHGGFLLMP